MARLPKDELRRSIQNNKDQIRTLKLKITQIKKEIQKLLTQIPDPQLYSNINYSMDPLPGWWKFGYHIRRQFNLELNHQYFSKKFGNLSNKYRSYQTLHQELLIKIQQNSDDSSSAYSVSSQDPEPGYRNLGSQALYPDESDLSFGQKITAYLKDTILGLGHFILVPFQYYLMPTPTKLTHEALAIHRSMTGSTGPRNQSTSSPATVGHHAHEPHKNRKRPSKIRPLQ